MFENLLTDLRHYREYCRADNGSLIGTFFYALYAHPASAGVFLYRFGHWSWKIRNPIFRGLFKLVYAINVPACRLYSGVQIHPCARIGKGLAILHFGGVVICRECRIGQQCLLHHNVSVVTTNTVKAAKIGDNFYGGEGVTIVGNLIIEDNVICGTGSVVTMSVPSNAIVGGVPARILRFRRETERPPSYVRGHHQPSDFLRFNEDNGD